MIKIKNMTYDEYISGLRSEIHEKGLYKAVKGRCDEINELASSLPYVSHRSIQEALCEIMDIVILQRTETGESKTESEEQNDRLSVLQGTETGWE